MLFEVSPPSALNGRGKKAILQRTRGSIGLRQAMVPRGVSARSVLRPNTSCIRVWEQRCARAGCLHAGQEGGSHPKM